MVIIANEMVVYIIRFLFSQIQLVCEDFNEVLDIQKEKNEFNKIQFD